MEAEMLELALEIPAELLQVASDDYAVTLLDGAISELHRRVECTRRLALGPLARGDVPDASFDSSALHLLQAARRAVHTLSSTHAAVGRVFSAARARIGARRHGDLLEAYEARRHDALLFAKDSLNKLLEAAGYAEAAADAFDVARGVSYASPLWRGWATAAEDLARAAHKEADAALDALLDMQHEVGLEYFAAWSILKAVQHDRWVQTAREVPATVYQVATFFPARIDDHQALGDLARLLALHDKAGRDLTSAARHLGLPRGNLWNRWSARHGEVASAGQEAACSVVSACSNLDLLPRALESLSRLRSAATMEYFDCSQILDNIVT